MTAELATLASTDLAALADPSQAIERACQRACEWLRSAVDLPIDVIIETKAQAAAVATFATQKQLGKDAEMAALEVQRRAERGVGLALRREQAAGNVAGQGRRTDRLEDRKPTLPELAQVKHRESLKPMFALADDVTDERFEEVVAEARAEGNLSRDHLVRKVKGHVTRIDRRRTTRLHFNATHPLASAAIDRCRDQGHEPLTHIGGACGECWETEIRLDAVARHRCPTCTPSSLDRDGIRRLILDRKPAAWIVNQGASRADVTEVLRELNRESARRTADAAS